MPKYPTFLPFFLADTYYPTAYYFITAYTSCFEITGHTVLSINRYCVIRNITIHKVCWSKRMTWMFYIILFVVPMLVTFYRLFTPAKYGFDKEGHILITYVNPKVSEVFLF